MTHLLKLSYLILELGMSGKQGPDLLHRQHEPVTLAGSRYPDSYPGFHNLNQ
jgi:hypothetical protein